MVPFISISPGDIIDTNNRAVSSDISSPSSMVAITDVTCTDPQLYSPGRHREQDRKRDFNQVNNSDSNMITEEDKDDIMINNAIIMDVPMVFMKEGDGT
jgi:hypothetical protein